MKSVLVAFVIFMICLLSFPPANAYLIDSSDDSALAGMGVITFENEALGRYDNSITVDGVTFTAGLTSITSANTMYDSSAHLHIDDFFTTGYGRIDSGAPYNVSGKYLDNGDFSDHPGADIITFSFTSSVNAFGFSWGCADLAWTLAAYDENDQLLESYTLPHWSPTDYLYVGIAAEGIAYAVLTNTHDDFTGWADISPDWIMIDDFRPGFAGSIPTVPEPTTMLLLGLGLVGLAGIKRKFKN